MDELEIRSYSNSGHVPREELPRELVRALRSMLVYDPLIKKLIHANSTGEYHSFMHDGNEWIGIDSSNIGGGRQLLSFCKLRTGSTLVTVIGNISSTDTSVSRPRKEFTFPLTVDPRQYDSENMVYVDNGTLLLIDELITSRLEYTAYMLRISFGSARDHMSSC